MHSYESVWDFLKFDPSPNIPKHQTITSHCLALDTQRQLVPPHLPGHDELDDQRDDEHAQAVAGVKTSQNIRLEADCQTSTLIFMWLGACETNQWLYPLEMNDSQMLFIQDVFSKGKSTGNP